MDTENVTVSVEAGQNGGVVRFVCALCGDALTEDFPHGFRCACGSRATAAEAKRAAVQAAHALIEAIQMLEAVSE